MKQAFIILSHKNPQQLRRLLDRLRHPAIDFYIHLDAKCDINEWQIAMNIPQVFFIEKRVDVTWAGYGTIQATLNGIASIVDSGHQYDFVHLISAQDYPLVNVNQLHDFFAAAPGRQFLNILPEAALQRVMSKITSFHFEDLRFPGKYRIAQLLNKLLSPRRHPLNLEVYGGSLWWSLTQECAAWCLTYVNAHPELKRFYKRTWGGDEFIFQTIIMNGPFKNSVENNYLRYIDWSEGKAHPKTFVLSDFDNIIQSGQLLARKFDLEKTPDLLNKIDSAAGHLV